MMNDLKLLVQKCLRWHPALQRWGKLYVRRHRARKTGYPDWQGILDRDRASWDAALAASRGGRKILVATSVGAHLPGTTVESLLAVALTLREASVHVLLCDAALPACLDCDVTWYPKQEIFVGHGPSRDLCAQCFGPAEAMYRSLGLAVHRYSDFLAPEDIRSAERISSSLPLDDLPGYAHDGVAVGEHALAGALRFFARASLDGEPHAEPVARRYLKAALITTFAAQRLMTAMRFDSAVFHHGIYVPQGLIGEVARRRDVRVVNWNPAYRKQCFIFSHGNTYHQTLMSEPVCTWENMDWSPAIEEELVRYLRSRWQGTEDWIWFHERPQIDVAAIAKAIGIDFSRPTIGMLTNVMWDAQLHYPANAFPNMLDWALETIRYFAGRPDLQLLVRVHPAELRGTLVSRQPFVEEVRKAFPVLPRNVFVIPPESPVSTYAAMAQCNVAIIYGTKTGVELTSMGIPVIVAGEAWIRNKGITLDATSRQGYLDLLDRLPLARMLDESTVRRARKYAYHFFYRRMIPLECTEPQAGWPPYRIALRDIRSLVAGCSPGMDVICNGILRGSDFVYPAERFARGRSASPPGAPTGT